MKLLLIRCDICYDWHSPKHHCFNCGAYHLHIHKAGTMHVNAQGVEMARALPANVDGMLNRLIKFVSSNVDSEV